MDYDYCYGRGYTYSRWEAIPSRGPSRVYGDKPRHSRSGAHTLPKRRNRNGRRFYNPRHGRNSNMPSVAMPF